MSLILTWENPTELATPTASLCRVERLSPTTGLLTESSTWGYFEDIETDDVTSVYQIVYSGYGASSQIVVPDRDIRRYKRQPDSLRLDFHLIYPDGSPSAGSYVEISDEPTGYRWLRRIMLNDAGRGLAFLQHGQRVFIRQEGQFKALDVVVPALPQLTFEELSNFGTILDADRRNWY
jgi:hypothetical protein